MKLQSIFIPSFECSSEPAKLCKELKKENLYFLKTNLSDLV